MAQTVFPVPSSGGVTQKVVEYTSTTSFTVPSNCSTVEVFLVGGGGGGGGSGTSPQYQSAGAGGAVGAGHQRDIRLAEFGNHHAQAVGLQPDIAVRHYDLSVARLREQRAQAPDFRVRFRRYAGSD